MGIKEKFDGLSADILMRNLYLAYFVPWMAATSDLKQGKNIFDEEWDLAIILDACRVDALRIVADEYDWLAAEEVRKVMSPGSSSKEWMVNTFHERNMDAIADTTYLTGNGWAEIVLSDDPEFSYWTVSKGTIAESSSLFNKLAHRPTVTEADFDGVIFQSFRDVGGIDALCAGELTQMAIKKGRDPKTDRMLVHYMQPHEPFLHRAHTDEGPTDIDKRPYDLLQQGEDKEVIWEVYLDNLRYVLDHVERLLNNFDAKVVITSDHGEMFGPAPLIGHGEGIPHPKLKWVPWVETMATDTKTEEPDVEISSETSDDVDDRLAALGYI